MILSSYNDLSAKYNIGLIYKNYELKEGYFTKRP